MLPLGMKQSRSDHTHKLTTESTSTSALPQGGMGALTLVQQTTSVSVSTHFLKGLGVQRQDVGHRTSKSLKGSGVLRQVVGGELPSTVVVPQTTPPLEVQVDLMVADTRQQAVDSSHHRAVLV